jgi:hypothetical protein
MSRFEERSELMKRIARIVVMAGTMAFGGFAQGAGETRLSLTTRINLGSRPSLRGMTIRDLVVTTGHMYFLAYPHPAQLVNGVLLRSDLTGRIDWRADLGGDEVEDLSVDHSGNCLVLSSPPSGTTRLRRFDTAGQPLGEPRSLPDITKLVTTSDGHVFGLTRSGFVRSIDDGASPIGSVIDPEHVQTASSIVSVGEGRIAVVDEREVAVVLVDPKLGTRNGRAIDHPEAFRVKAMYQAEEAQRSGLHGRTILLSAAYDGNIYCMLSGFKAEEGAPVVVVDSKGQVSKLLRCAVSYPSPSGKASASIPTAFSIDSGLLYMLDSEGFVSVFRL